MKKLLVIIVITFFAFSAHAQFNTSQESPLTQLENKMNFAAHMILDRQAKIQTIVCTFDSTQRALDIHKIDINTAMPIFNQCNKDKITYETEIEIYQSFLQRSIQEVKDIRQKSQTIAQSAILYI